MHMRCNPIEHQMRPRAASTNQRTPQAQSHGYLLLALACLTNCWPAASLAADESLNLNAANFAIYSHDGAKIVGRSHYDVEHFAGGAVIFGDNTYADGERDVERERSSSRRPCKCPCLPGSSTLSSALTAHPS